MIQTLIKTLSSMKQLLIILISALSLWPGFGQDYQTYTDKKERTQLWGQIPYSALSAGNFAEAFKRPSQGDLDSMIQLDLQDREVLSELRLKVFIGTWCGDSKKWVPQILDYLKSQGMSEDQWEIIALHNSDSLYKQGPQQEEQAYMVHRVPTFIFEEEESEIGRIVESPITSVDIDIAQIVKGIPTKPRYSAANHCMKFFSKNPVWKFDKEFENLYRTCYEEVRKSNELNTLAYVYKARGEYDKALKVANLNSFLFRHEPKVHDTLAEMHACVAGQCYEKVLKINPEDKHASRQLERIETVIHPSEEENP